MGVPPIKGLKKTSKKTDQFEIDDFDDLTWIHAIEKSFTFVWCDGRIGTDKNLEDNHHTMWNIANLINRKRKILHTFNDLNACREFLIDANNVCLIISGTMGEELVPTIHNLQQIHSIYIFCLNKIRHEQWAKFYPKIRGVFVNIIDIRERLKSDIISQLSIDYDQIEFDLIYSQITLPIINKNELSLIYSKLMKIILLNMDSLDHGKHDMINYCRNKYTSEYQIQLLNDFERNYSQFNPIWWYTKNSFFQGIINRALRTHDLYVLCSMYRFIKDIDNQLIKLYEQQQQTTTESLILYFGQFLSKYDFQKLNENCGELMCINQFLSANPEKGIALMFLKQPNTSKILKTKIPVLFQIYIDQTIEPNVFYANIGSISQFVQEKDYLISISSIYRINKIEKLVDISSIYMIQLTLIPQNDLQYNNLTQSIQKEQLNINKDLTELGYEIKNRLSIFKSTNKLFKQRLIDGERTALLHFNMAIIYDLLDEYDKSMQEYEFVINFIKICLPDTNQKYDICHVPVFGNIGLTYQEQDKFTFALDNAMRALSIVTEFEMNSLLKKELQSSCCYNLGLIHDQAGKFLEAKMFYEEALKIQQEYLPIGHSDVTNLQRLVTLLSSKQSDSDEIVSNRI